MPLVCADLAEYGVILLPPGSHEYRDLLSGIERSLKIHPDGRPPVEQRDFDRITEHRDNSAILVNLAPVAIASLAYIWSVRTDGRIRTHCFLPGTHASILLPFYWTDRIKKFDAFWNTIFPGSSRLLIPEAGKIYGDNTDVRAPAQDELRLGDCFVTLVPGGFDGIRESVKLSLDGVFFADGGFAGPNQLGSWEHLVAARETYLSYAVEARESDRAGFFDRMQQARGAAPLVMPSPYEGLDGSAIREYQRQQIAHSVLLMRERLGDTATLAAVAAWRETPGPEPHRL